MAGRKDKRGQKRAVDQVEHVCPDAQAEIARLIESEIAGKKRDVLFA